MSGSQVTNLDGQAQMANLIFENYIQGVHPFLEFMDPIASIFEAATEGDFQLTGEKLVFFADDKFASGAMSTSGNLPDTEYQDGIQLETVPTRSYVRRAVDNFWAVRAQAPGAFAPYIGRIMEQMWDAWERTQSRHIHGSSAATICLVDSRTSNTQIVVKDGYGYATMDPLVFLDEGHRLAWLDASNSFALGGVGVISNIDYDNRVLTFSASIENGPSTPTIASNDVFVAVTTTNQSAAYFETERGLSPLGLMDHIDPLSANASYLGVNESSSPRIKPIRTTSSDFGEVELMKFLKKIQAKGQAQVTSDSHVLTAQEAVTMQYARTLIPFTQINQKGGPLPGGWETVRIGNHDFVESTYHIPDTVYALCKEDLRRVTLDGEADIFAGDGSEWSRLADFDGKELFVKHYCQRFLKRRNRCGALVQINITDDPRDFSASPSLLS